MTGRIRCRALHAPATMALTMLVVGCAGTARVDEGASATLAATSPPPTVAATRADANAPEGKGVRCISEPITGSRVPQRVCRSESEWNTIEQQSKDRTRDLQGPIYGSDNLGPPL